MIAPNYLSTEKDCQVLLAGMRWARRIAEAHRKFGTTGLMPTLITDDMPVMRAAISAVYDAIAQGVPSQDIFCDHAGFSTYESMYRAKYVFGCERIVVATQTYHLYRALYIARALGLTAYGVSCDTREYNAYLLFDLRETLARCKDFLYSIFQPLPTYLGDVIPITGDGSATNG